MRPVTALLLATLTVTASVLLAAEPTMPKPTAAPEKAQPAEAKPATDTKSDKAGAAAKPADAKDAKDTKDTKDTKDAKDAKIILDKPAEAAAQATAKSPDKGPSPQRFIPSEQVRADFDVSFPIDI